MHAKGAVCRNSLLWCTHCDEAEKSSLVLCTIHENLMWLFFLQIREQNLQDIKTAGPQSQVLSGVVVDRSLVQVRVQPALTHKPHINLWFPPAVA